MLAKKKLAGIKPKRRKKKNANIKKTKVPGHTIGSNGEPALNKPVSQMSAWLQLETGEQYSMCLVLMSYIPPGYPEDVLAECSAHPLGIRSVSASMVLGRIAKLNNALPTLSQITQDEKLTRQELVLQQEEAKQSGQIATHKYPAAAMCHQLDKVSMRQLRKDRKAMAEHSKYQCDIKVAQQNDLAVVYVCVDLYS
jgi:hypothetical protein